MKIRSLLKKDVLLFCVLFSHVVANGQRPNIIYIMTDDMGYGDLSGYGRKDYSTPNLDKLASQGVKFINAYAAAPLCTPTRAAFMTGRYPAKTPVGLIEPLTDNHRDSAYGLTGDYPSVATLMKTGGYRTALIGKWHLGFLPQHSPLKNGFDYFFGIHSGAADYVSYKGNGRRHDLYENDSPVYPTGYLTDLISQKAVAFIKQKHNSPFFLAITYTAPHWPWQVRNDKPYADTANFRNGGSAAIYAEMMKSLDEGVGEILKALDDEQLSKQTIVIFTNDNGGERYSEHAGLNGSKATLWEGGIRVPAFVRWPGKIHAGIVTPQAAITMDWTATILAAAGLRAHTAFPPDGVNLLPVLTGKRKNIDRVLYWRTIQPKRQQYAARMREWKYLKDEKGEYLFNLVADQGEKNDLKASQPTIFNQLKKKYVDWEKTLLEPIPY